MILCHNWKLSIADNIIYLLPPREGLSSVSVTSWWRNIDYLLTESECDVCIMENIFVWIDSQGISNEPFSIVGNTRINGK